MSLRAAARVMKTPAGNRLDVMHNDPFSYMLEADLGSGGCL